MLPESKEYKEFVRLHDEASKEFKEHAEKSLNTPGKSEKFYMFIKKLIELHDNDIKNIKEDEEFFKNFNRDADRK